MTQFCFVNFHFFNVHSVCGYSLLLNWEVTVHVFVVLFSDISCCAPYVVGLPE